MADPVRIDMMDGPVHALLTGQDGDDLALIGTARDGVCLAFHVPRRLLAAVSALRIWPDRIEGRSMRTGKWDDLAKHGARVV